MQCNAVQAHKTVRQESCSLVVAGSAFQEQEESLQEHIRTEQIKPKPNHQSAQPSDEIMSVHVRLWREVRR